MKAINLKASAILDALTAGLPVGGSRHVDNSPAYMRVCVERIGEYQYSVAHYFEQNGDLCQDPEMVFHRMPAGGRWFPVFFQQALPPVYRVALELGAGGEVSGYRPRTMAEQCLFAGTWMRNIIEQQAGGDLRALRAIIAAGGAGWAS